MSIFHEGTLIGIRSRTFFITRTQSKIERNFGIKSWTAKIESGCLYQHFIAV